MFLIRRLIWFATGATAGFGGAMWIRRQVLRRLEQLVPERVAAEAGRSARRARLNLVDAVREGRDVARGREAELRAELRPGSRPATGGPVPVPGPAGPSDQQLRDSGRGRERR